MKFVGSPNKKSENAVFDLERDIMWVFGGLFGVFGV